MRYEKPIVNVIDLQIKENIAAVDTTVYKGANVAAAAQAAGTTELQMALTTANSGVGAIGGLVTES